MNYNISDTRFWHNPFLIMRAFNIQDAFTKILCSSLKWCMILPRSFQDFVNSMMHVRLTSKMVYYILLILELSLKRSQGVLGLHGVGYCNVVNVGCHSLCGFFWCQELFKMMPWQPTLGKFGFAKVHNKTTNEQNKDVLTDRQFENWRQFVNLIMQNHLLKALQSHSI